MSYSKQTWVDGPSGGTPLSAARLNFMEAGIEGRLTTATKTGAYTLTSSDDVIFANAVSAGFTLTLPSASTIVGRAYEVKKTDASTNVVTIATTGGQTIDGASTRTIGVQYGSLTVMSDGTNWMRLNEQAERYIWVPSFAKNGALSVSTGLSRLYNDLGYDLVIEKVRATVGTAPTGSTLIVDVNKAGTTLFTSQGNRPTVAISGFTVLSAAPDVTSWAAGDYLTIDVDQIGSTVAGSDLQVQPIVRRA